jgi:hypothetical protein
VAGYPDYCVWDNGFLRGQLVSDSERNSGNVGFIAGEEMETEVEAGMVRNSPAHWGW